LDRAGGSIQQEDDRDSTDPQNPKQLANLSLNN
jgi:hypothetical protein